MAMTARLWSISALAVELDIDRRTVAKRLRNVPPAGRLKGSPAWRLGDALKALRGEESVKPPRPDPIPPPPGAAVLARIDEPFTAGVVAGALGMIYPLPHFVREVALKQGLSERLATDLAAYVTFSAIGEAERQFRQTGCEVFQDPQPDWLEPAAFWWLPKAEGAAGRDDEEAPAPA